MATHEVESPSHRAVHQLAVLRSTYPGWKIQHITGGSESDTWTARLRRERTQRMRNAGVKEHLEAPDAVSLGAMLSQQVALVHDTKACSWPG